MNLKQESIQITLVPNNSQTEISAAPTQEAPPSEATPTPTPTEPTFTAEPPVAAEITQIDLQPTAETSPAPEKPADVQIFRPGELSRVASPFEIRAYTKPGAKGAVTIELFGETGKLLFREVRQYAALPGASVNILMDLEYEIASVAEVGRLVISTRDEANRIIALNSVNVILLSLGEADINPATAANETIFIEEPGLKSLVQGGMVRVSGMAKPDTEQPLRVELIDEQGRVVGQRLAGVARSDVAAYGIFAVDVPYQVERLTPVRVLVFESGDPISPIRHLSSTEILLSP